MKRVEHRTEALTESVNQPEHRETGTAIAGRSGNGATPARKSRHKRAPSQLSELINDWIAPLMARKIVADIIATKERTQEP